MPNEDFSQLPSEGFVRINQVLKMFAISRSSLWRRIKAGQLPKPHKIGPKVNVWDVAELRATKDSITRGVGSNE